MRIGSGDNLIDLFEEDSSVMPTEPDEIEDDNNQGDGDNSYLIISGDGDTISGAGLAATNTFTGINYFNNTVYFNNNNTNNVYLYYHGSEVLTRSDLSESGGFNFGSKAGLNSDNVFSGSNRFSNKLYYGTSSNTNTEVATHQWVNNQNYATETWVTNNYCEVNGPTIQDIKDRLTALENA